MIENPAITDTQASASKLKPPAPLAGPTEKHTWKLGNGVWADITITGGLSPRAFEKLKKYVDLIDVSEEDPYPEEDPAVG